MKIFIAGPRALMCLDKNIEDILNSCMKKGFQILVGDAVGADSLVQRYLTNKGYMEVTVYVSNGIVRNNIGNWEVKSVPVEKSVHGFAFYAEKDRAMAKDADVGFMLWNGKSKGTLNNMINLLDLEKQTIVYIPHTGNIHNITKLATLERLTRAFGEETHQRFKLLLSDKVKNNQISLFDKQYSNDK